LKVADSFPIPFGRYTLVERLAMGGMAELFIATAPGEHGFQKKVVIKRLLPHLAREPVYTAMFIDEAKLTAALVHPKIAQTHDLGRNENDLFIAMEFVDGIDVLALLREHAWQRKRIPVEQAVWICHEVLDALDFAHNLTDERGASLGIVHRDISPSNILLSRRGDVKLVDFGIARASATGRHHRTKSGTLKGKYGYMSPEQVTEQPIDARSDLFSVGVVLAEMLCGRRLFAAAAELDVLLMVRDAKLARLDQFGGHIPPALDSILRRTLRKEPAERWSSAAELRDTLGEWLFQERHRIGPKNIAELVDTFHDTAWRRRRESIAKAAAAVESAGQAAVSGADALAPEPETPSELRELSSDDQLRRQAAPAPAPSLLSPSSPSLLPPPPAFDPREPTAEAGPFGAPDAARRRRANSTDGLPIIAIEQPPALELDLGLELPDVPLGGASTQGDPGAVALAEDSVDLDLADLTDPQELQGRGLDRAVENDVPSVRALMTSPPVAEARAGSRPAIEPPRAASSPAPEPQRSYAMTRNSGRTPAPTSARPPVALAASGPSMALEDDDELGLGPAGPPRPIDHVGSGRGRSPSSPAVAVPPPASSPTATPTSVTRVPTGRHAAPTPDAPYAPARGSTPDLSLGDLDPPVPPPNRGGPTSGPHARSASQPIMSAAARNRAISTAPPAEPGSSSGSRRPGPRTTAPPARAYLGGDIDALADDIDAAVQQLQAPAAIDEHPGIPVAIADEVRTARTSTRDDSDTLGARRRATRPVDPPVPATAAALPALDRMPAPAVRPAELPAGAEHEAPTVRGDFASIPPMTVLFRLATAGATGLLTAQVGGIRKEIFVRGGIPEYVTSNMASELLGNYLVAHGALSSGELAMALAMMPHYGGKLGDTLVGLGLLKPLEVFRYLNHQVREKLIDVCTWTKGSYGWHEGLTNQKNAFPIELNPFEVLGAGALAARDDVVSGWLNAVSAARVVRVRARPAIELERFEQPGLAPLFEKIDGARSLRDLVTEALEPPVQRRHARFLRLLVHCELVRLEGG
jgi:serine/threonine protein kinase